MIIYKGVIHNDTVKDLSDLMGKHVGNHKKEECKTNGVK